MKKVEIRLGGTGHEITRSSFTCEEIKKIKEYCKENDEDIESVLTNDLEEVLENRGPWYECDNLGHFMGGNLSCKLYVTVDGDEYEFETGDVVMSTHHVETVDEEGLVSDLELAVRLNDDVMVSFITWEKGILNTWEFEIGDDDEFDINKVKLHVEEVETNDSLYSLIEELWYEGLPIEGEGFSDTDGKSFDVEIDYCEEDE